MKYNIPPLIDALSGNDMPVFGPTFVAQNKHLLDKQHIAYVLSPVGEQNTWKAGKGEDGGTRFNDYTAKMKDGYYIHYIRRLPKTADFEAGTPLVKRYEDELLKNLRQNARPAPMPNAPDKKRGREWFAGTRTRIAKSIEETNKNILKDGVERPKKRASTRVTQWVGSAQKPKKILAGPTPKREGPGTRSRNTAPTSPWFVVQSNVAAVENAKKKKKKDDDAPKKKWCRCPCP